MRPTLPSAALLVLFTFGTVAAQDAESPAATWPPPDASIYGELAFSEAITFDYDRDDTPERVQFWIQLKGQPAAGEPGKVGARPESGSVSYFVLDLESGQRIDDWLMGFNMGGAMTGGFPVAGEEYPLTNIRITGRTAQFDLRGSTWTIRDGGEGLARDEIRIRTGEREREGRFYDGDVTVVAPRGVITEPVEIRENRKCNRCHEEAAVSMAADGGPHGEIFCADCHVEHPPKAPGTFPQCLECHDPHNEAMAAASCVTCHSSHNVDVVEYAITVPDEHCAACHEDSVTELQASGTRHMGLDCAVCHQDEHGAIPSCTHCHSGPHSEKVMTRPERCARCHNSAHETKIGRREPS